MSHLISSAYGGVFVVRRARDARGWRGTRKLPRLCRIRRPVERCGSRPSRSPARFARRATSGPRADSWRSKQICAWFTPVRNARNWSGYTAR